ncbi:PREDICTED: uncharacterized protein LOC107068326 [Polistes dominula]|uniref:Uncharacterized protein LOC107068326 n=1 Tax=Polistes dominula TaxID=743375 RepID=A0ABM1IIM8_POLDO|nr:PREDICTED: uncharacterized protein LOC107068326 [Polistes dominula]
MSQKSDNTMDFSKVLQELETSKRKKPIYKKLITYNRSLKDYSLSDENAEKWQLILENIVETLAKYHDTIIREEILLASHAFFEFLSIPYGPKTMQKYITYFLEEELKNKSKLSFSYKKYKINNSDLFQLIIIHGYLQVNKYNLYSDNILSTMFKILYPFCTKYSLYTYFAYKLLINWLNASINIDFWNTDSSSSIEQNLEEIIFSNWHNSINDINKQNATQIFHTYLNIMTEKYHGFMEYIFNNVINMSWQNETKYIILSEIFKVSKASRIREIITEDFLFNLSTSLTKNHLHHYGTKVYLNILNILSEEDWKKSFTNVIKYLINQWEIGPKKNYYAIKSLCNLWIEPTIKKYKTIITLLRDIVKDLKVPYFDSHFQRITSKLYITVSLHTDIISFIRHENDIVRLNGFTICCYEHIKLYNHDQMNNFFIMKQFLWYNANTTSLFLRNEIKKCFKIFYTNVLKISENVEHTQFMCEIIDWLNIFLLDCFEPGSCYQRKIFALNLYKIILSVTYTYTCKHPLKVKNDSRFVPNDKCVILDTMVKFTNRTFLLVLLNLIENSALDIKQITTSIIINYFDEDVLISTEKKVIFDIAIKECNSLKFYKVDSGAALMKVFSTWEPFIQEYITDEHGESISCNHYYEFFLHIAEKQLLELKEKPLDASVNNEKPFYGILTAMFTVYFQRDTKKCIPPLKFVKKLLDFLDGAINILLSKLSPNSETTDYASSFKDMGLAINYIIQTSKLSDEINDDFTLIYANQIILSCIWLSLKVSCEIADAIGSFMYSEETTLHSVKLITTVLMKCRHKGIIETAGVALGNLVRCISKQEIYAKKLEMYVEHLLDDNTMNNINITRRGAGLTLMFHKIVSNDIRHGRPFLHFVVQRLQNYIENFPVETLESNEPDITYDPPLVRYLFFLRELVTDKEIHAQLVSYIDDITVACFRCLKSTNWQIRNASLHLFGSLVPRLVGQSIGDKSLDFGNGYHIYHFITHYPKLKKRISKFLKIISKLSTVTNSILPDYSNLVHPLVLLSKFSVSGCYFIDHLANEFVQEMKSYFNKLMGIPVGYVRLLTAKAYAALTPFSCIKSEIETFMLNILSENSVNMLHGQLLTINYLQEKFLAEAECVTSSDKIDLINVFPKLKYLDESRIENIMKVWNNELKLKGIEKICYTIECTFIKSFQWKSFTLNFELFDNIILNNFDALHNIAKTNANFSQFIDMITYLYANYIKSHNTFNANALNKIIRSEYIDLTINLLSHLHNYPPILEYILNVLSSMIDNNGNELIINAMIKLLITTFKNSLLNDLYEFKLHETARILLRKLERKISIKPYVLHLRHVLIVMFSKNDNLIYRTLIKMFHMTLSDNAHLQYQALECLQLFAQRFSEVIHYIQMLLMHCCLVLMKNHIFEIRDSACTIIQDYIFSNIYKDKIICKHNEIVYQQLLLEIINYDSYKYFYINDIKKLIIKFIGVDDNSYKQLSSIESPFKYDYDTYREETKFINILYFYIQCKTKSDCMIKCDKDHKNYIDISRIIESKYEILRKINFNVNDIQTLLTIEDKDYLFKKQVMLMEEFKQNKC